MSDGCGEEKGDSSISSPKNPWKATAPDPLYAVENKITSLEIPIIWTAPGVKGKIDVQFIDKNTVLFRIDNEALRNRVIKRRYWHISDVPLVLHEWSPETAAAPPDLSAMPLWVDLKSVPSHLFSIINPPRMASDSLLDLE
ncbi:hypothetical protein DY000_02059012 [Brassica cretica]|uniref:DUF4283 domain-containing protein n=1 Tax=Brassica cretica TaxID=69181 RepID=A0ABQ7B1W7_BRACR|nr:hypothetical protein DY000_02059012 [Brassica cretica]